MDPMEIDFSSEDFINPAYCKYCKKHIPVLMVIANNGVCTECIDKIKNTFTDDDKMMPIYCTICRKHIPRAESQVGKGLCIDCMHKKAKAQKTIQTIPCPNCHQNLPLTSSKCLNCGYDFNTKSVQSQNLAESQPIQSSAQNVPPSSISSIHSSNQQYASMRQEYASGPAVLALVFGIIGFFTVIPGLLAYIIGKNEIKRIDQGLSSEAGRSIAFAGYILGVISLIETIIALVYLLVVIVFPIIYFTNNSR